MSLSRIPLLLALAYLSDLSFTPPNPHAKPHEVVNVDTNAKEVREMESRAIALLIHKWAYTTLCLFECAVIFALNYTNHAASPYILQYLIFTANPTSSALRIQPTPTANIGSALIIIGACIRLLCYRELGRLFTFEFSVFKDHELVTSGPYSIVRHPSYTGMVFILAGSVLFHFTSGSYMKECGVMDSWVGWILVWSWMVFSTGRTVRAIQRSKDEDDLMRKQFPDEWKVWANDVKYKFFPGIL